MKRDDEFLRNLLLEWEAQDDWLITVQNTYSASDEQRRVYGHTLIAMDAGLVAQVSNQTYRLTSQGHDYLDALRDKGIWEETKQVVSKTGGNVTLSLLRQIAEAYLKKKIADHTGLNL